MSRKGTAHIEAVIIKPTTNVSSPEFEDLVLSKSIVNLRGFGYHPSLSHLHISISELSRKYGQSTLYVLNQEVNVYGWNLQDKTNWQKMRLGEYIEFVSVLKESVDIAEYIFPQATHSRPAPLIESRTLSIPFTNPFSRMNKFQLSVLLSQPGGGRLRVAGGKVRCRDVPLPAILAGAFLFWPGITLRDFRVTNAGASVPACVEVTHEYRSHAEIGSLWVTCNDILHEKTYFPPSSEQLHDTSRLCIEAFNSRHGLQCLQICGLGFHLLYVGVALCRDEGTNISYTTTVSDLHQIRGGGYHGEVGPHIPSVGPTLTQKMESQSTDLPVSEPEHTVQHLEAAALLGVEREPSPPSQIDDDDFTEDTIIKIVGEVDEFITTKDAGCMSRVKACVSEIKYYDVADILLRHGCALDAFAASVSLGSGNNTTLFQSELLFALRVAFTSPLMCTKVPDATAEEPTVGAPRPRASVEEEGIGSTVMDMSEPKECMEVGVQLVSSDHEAEVSRHSGEGDIETVSHTSGQEEADMQESEGLEMIRHLEDSSSSPGHGADRVSRVDPCLPASVECNNSSAELSPRTNTRLTITNLESEVNYSVEGVLDGADLVSLECSDSDVESNSGWREQSLPLELICSQELRSLTSNLVLSHPSPWINGQRYVPTLTTRNSGQNVAVPCKLSQFDPSDDIDVTQQAPSQDVNIFPHKKGGYFKSKRGRPPKVIRRAPIKAVRQPLVDLALHTDPFHYHSRASQGLAKDNIPLEQALGVMLSGRVLFGSNIDAVGWNDYMEAMRLAFPAFLWCGSQVDLLRLLRQNIEGMNTPQVYLKTPGVWTGGHEENARFRSLNLNMGPDPCEWSAIDATHAAEFRSKVLARHGIDIYKQEGVWFPSAKDLHELGIPFSRGLQEAGDCIVLDGATLHWVRALGFSFHFSWNFGLASFRQLDLALDRYNANLAIDMRNLVPMHTLLLDLAREILDPQSQVGVRAGVDIRLVERTILELTESMRLLYLNLTRVVESLSLECQPEEAGSMVLRCQSESCQKEIFGAYFSCLHCRLSCLDCALHYCRRSRNVRALSASIHHEGSSIFIRDDLNGIKSTIMQLCKKYRTNPALKGVLSHTRQILATLVNPGSHLVKRSRVEEADGLEMSASMPVRPALDVVTKTGGFMTWQEKHAELVKWLARHPVHSFNDLITAVVVLERPVYGGRRNFPMGIWLKSQRNLRCLKRNPSRFESLKRLLGPNHAYFSSMSPEPSFETVLQLKEGAVVTPMKRASEEEDERPRPQSRELKLMSGNDVLLERKRKRTKLTFHSPTSRVTQAASVGMDGLLRHLVAANEDSLGLLATATDAALTQLAGLSSAVGLLAATEGASVSVDQLALEHNHKFLLEIHALVSQIHRRS